MMKAKETKEDAASPVIGVMLMIVVTIVIAAIIAAFSGAIVGNSSGPAPSIDFAPTLSNETGLTLKSLGVSNPNGDIFNVYLKWGDQEYKVGTDTVAGFTTGNVINIPTSSLRQGFVTAFTDYTGYKESGAYINGTHVGNIYTVTLYNKDGKTVLGTHEVTLTA